MKVLIVVACVLVVAAAQDWKPPTREDFDKWQKCIREGNCKLPGSDGSGSGSGSGLPSGLPSGSLPEGLPQLPGGGSGYDISSYIPGQGKPSENS